MNSLIEQPNNVPFEGAEEFVQAYSYVVNEYGDLSPERLRVLIGSLIALHNQMI